MMLTLNTSVRPNIYSSPYASKNALSREEDVAPMAIGTLDVQMEASRDVGSRTREAHSSLSALRMPNSMIISATVEVATII